MARAIGAKTAVAAVFESSYGVSPASGYKRMPLASSDLGAAQGLLANELLGYGRDPLAPIGDVIDVNGTIKVPIDAEAFGVWLKGLFGAPTTTGTDPYTHVFESGGTTLPSLSIETQFPDVPHFAMVAGINCGTLQFNMERGGLLTADIGTTGQGETTATSTAAGALTPFELLRFGNFQGSIQRNGSPFTSVVSASVSYSNGLDPVAVIRSDGKIDGIDPGISALSGQLRTRFATQALFTQAETLAACSLSFGWSRPSGESLTFAVPKVYISRPRVPVEGPGGVEVTYDWQAAQDDGGDPMVTVTLVNSVASY